MEKDYAVVDLYCRIAWLAPRMMTYPFTKTERYRVRAKTRCFFRILEIDKGYRIPTQMIVLESVGRFLETENIYTILELHRFYVLL